MINNLPPPSTLRLWMALGLGTVSFALGVAPFSHSYSFGTLFGLRASSTSSIGYERALGVRDGSFGLAYILSYLKQDVRAIDTLVLCQGMVGIGDGLVVLMMGGDPKSAAGHLIAGAGAVGLGLLMELQWKRGGPNKYGKDS